MQNSIPGIFLDTARPLTTEDRKEVSLLKNLGFDSSQISYMVHLKIKQKLREKWEKRIEG